MPHAIAPYLTPLNLAYALIAINLIAFAMFGFDKAKAERGAYRISEASLLWLAFWGGTPGAYAGRALFRHKTRKQPFSSYLHRIAVLQVLVLGGLIGWWVLTGRAPGTKAAVATTSAVNHHHSHRRQSHRPASQ